MDTIRLAVMRVGLFFKKFKLEKNLTAQNLRLLRKKD